MSSATGIEYIKGTAYCFIDSVILNRKLNKRYKISSVIFSEVRFHYQDPFSILILDPSQIFPGFLSILANQSEAIEMLVILRFTRMREKDIENVPITIVLILKKTFNAFQKYLKICCVALQSLMR